MPDAMPDRCPSCQTPSEPFMHECNCTALGYKHIVCDACNTAFKPETLVELAQKEGTNGSTV